MSFLFTSSLFRRVADSTPTIAVSPEMLKLLQRVKDKGKMTAREIGNLAPHASKTGKALLDHGLLEFNKYDIVVTPLGDQLLTLEPRWSQTKKVDAHGRPNEMWRVVVEGGILKNFVEKRPIEKNRKELAPVPTRTTAL